MTDASIPLQVRPPQLADPLEQYGKILSLRNMQVQQQQQQQMAPLLYRERQAQADAAALQVQQMQQAQRDQEIWGEALKRAQAPRPASPGAAATSSPVSQPDSDNTGSAGAAPTPSAAKVPASNDNGAPRSIDILGVAHDALQHGLSPGFYNAQVAAAIKHREDLAKLSGTEQALTDKNHDAYLGRLAAFRGMSSDYKQQNWANFNQQAFSDGLLTPAEYQRTIQEHPDLPDDDTLDHYMLGMQVLSGQRKAALTASQTAAAKAREASALATKAKTDEAATQQHLVNAVGKLTSAKDPAAFMRLAEANKVPAEQYGDVYDYFDKAGNPIPEKMAELNRSVLSPKEKVAEADKAPQREQQLIADTSARMRDFAKQGAAAYTRAYDQLPPAVQALFTKPENFDPKQTWKDAERIGLTSAQGVTSEDSEKYKDAMVALAGRRVDLAENKETTQQHNDRMGQLWAWALKDANGDPAVAKANLANPNFYPADHPLAADAQGILRYAAAAQGLDARTAAAQAKANKGGQLTGIEKLQWMKDHPGQPLPTTVQPPAKPAAQPAPASKTATPPTVAAQPAAQQQQPKIPQAALAIHAALKAHNIPFTNVDGADGLPILDKDGKQFKVLGLDKDGNLQLQPGTWK